MFDNEAERTGKRCPDGDWLGDKEPGGMDCEDCGCIFISNDGRPLCKVCHDARSPPPVDTKAMRSITEVPAHCPAFFCPWGGVTGECDSGDDGVLLCPQCGVPVTIEYSEHERSPEPQSGDASHNTK